MFGSQLNNINEAAPLMNSIAALLFLFFPSPPLAALPAKDAPAFIIDYSPKKERDFTVVWEKESGRRMVLRYSAEYAIFLTRWNQDKDRAARALGCGTPTFIMWPDENEAYIDPPGSILKERTGVKTGRGTTDMLEFCAPPSAEPMSAISEFAALDEALEQATDQLGSQAKSITPVMRGQNIDAALLLVNRPSSWTANSDSDVFWLVLKGRARVKVAGQQHQLRPKNILVIPPSGGQTVEVAPSGADPFAALQVSLSGAQP